MNKKFLIFVLILLTAVFLTASFVGCDENGEKGTYVLAIDNIVGVSDAVIDNEAKTVAFRVQNSIDAFPLSSITFKDGEMLVYEAYADEALTQKYEGENIPLAEGDNVFWVKGWFALAADKYAVYKFTVTRTRSEQSVKSIALDADTWKTQYMVNEMMPQCYIIVTYSDDTTEKVLLTADMITGFDTSSPGIREITISYKGSTLTTSVEVKEVTDGDGALTLGAWQTAYFIGEEIYLDGAYLLYDDGKTVSRIAITADMVTGFDTSAEGTKQIKISYTGKSVLAEIKVYALDDGEYEEVKKSTLDADKFVANMNRIFGYFNVDINNWSDHDRNMLIDMFEYLGVTDSDIDSVVSVLTASDSTLLEDISTLIMSSDPDVSALFTDSNVKTVTETLRIVKDKISAKQIAKLASIFVKMAYGYMDVVSIEDQDGWGYNIDFTNRTQSGHMTSSLMSITAQDMLKFINGDANALAVFEEYTSKESSDYSQIGDIEKVLSMDETAYVAGAVLDSIAAACDYDEQKIFDMVALSKKIVEAVTTGDLDKLLGGQAEGLSYKAMVAQINELGKFLKTLNQTFADDPLLVRCGSAVLDEILNIWSDTMMVAFDGNTAVNAVLALEKVAIECLMKIDANFVAGLYLDYDDYAKESDEIVKDQKFGYIAAKIAAFVYPEYQKLELREKTAIDDATEMVNMIGVPFNIRGIVDFMEKAAVKDADDYSATELKAFADEFYKLINGESVETEDRLFIMPYGTVLVNVNCTKEDLAQAIAQSAQVVLYDASLGTNLIIDDLSAYTINYDAGKEGFFSAEIVIEGAKATIECYAYDSTTPTKFVLYKDRRELNGYIFEKGQSVSAENGNRSLSFKHKETGKIITVIADITGFGSAVDTSEAGYSLSTIKYSNDIFGEIELPVLITAVDLANVTPDMVNRVYFQYCDILPQDSKILIHADVTFAFIFNESIEVIVTDLDSSTLGETTFTATLAENENGIEYSEQLKVTVVTKEEAMTVTDAYVSSYSSDIVVALGTPVDEMEFSYNVSFKYFPDNNSGSGTFVDLNANNLAVQGLKITVEDFDTSVITQVGEPRTATVRLVSVANESIVFAENTFEYSVYDEASEPPVVISMDEQLDWALSHKVFAQSEVSSANVFFNTITERFSFPIPTVRYSDGSTDYFDIIMENGGFDENTCKIVLTQTHDYGSYKSYGVDVYVGYAHIKISEIYVIPDALKNIPTSLSVYYKEHFPTYAKVLIDESLSVDNVYSEIEFGYGYSDLEVNGADEREKFTVTGDVSEEGMKQLTVTYTMSGVTLSAKCSVNVITLEDALSYSEGYVGNSSYMLSPDNANEDALLGMISTGEFLSYKEFEVDAYNLKAANEEWAGKGLNVRFAIRNADGELDAFDSAAGVLRECTLVLIASCYGHDAEVEVATIRYSVANANVDKVSNIDYVNYDRTVITESERTSGAWKDLVTVQYTKAGTFDTVTLSELTSQNADMTAELVYDSDRDGYHVVIEGDYVYYDSVSHGYIDEISDAEATKVTDIRINYLNKALFNSEPVGGADYEIMVVYGNGVSKTALADYSAVTVRKIEVYEYNHKYEISYMDFKCYAEFYVISEVSIGFDNVEYIAYERNGDPSGVRLFGQIDVSCNNGNMTSKYDCEGKTLAELNAEFEIIGVEIVVSGLDLSLGTEEQGTVTVSANGENPCEVIAIEITGRL